MARTTDVAVKAVLLDNYDGSSVLDSFIETATAIVDDLNTYATEEEITVSATRLELIERWLAAHYYTVADPLFTSKNSLKAGGSFNQRSYWEEAKRLDPTGYLRTMESGSPRAGCDWLGLVPSEQTDYEDRD